MCRRKIERVAPRRGIAIHAPRRFSFDAGHKNRQSSGMVALRRAMPCHAAPHQSHGAFVVPRYTKLRAVESHLKTWAIIYATVNCIDAKRSKHHTQNNYVTVLCAQRHLLFKLSKLFFIDKKYKKK